MMCGNAFNKLQRRAAGVTSITDIYLAELFIWNGQTEVNITWGMRSAAVTTAYLASSLN